MKYLVYFTREKKVKIYWITKYTTTGYSFPLIKKREEEKEDEFGKPVLNK